MKRKFTHSLTAFILAVLLLFTLVGRSARTAYATTQTQSEIEELEKEKESLNDKQQTAQSKIEQLKEEKADAIEQKEALDERNAYAREQLEIVKEQVRLYDELIARKGIEVEEAKCREEEQLERYRTRVRAMEENGSFDLLTLLFKAESFSELLAAVDDINEIMEADRRLEEDYIAARQAHEQVLAEYEQSMRELEERREELREEQEELERMIKEAVDLIINLEADIEQAQKEYEAAQRAIDAANYQIGELIAQINRQNAQTTPESSTGGEESSQNQGQTQNDGNQSGTQDQGQDQGNQDQGNQDQGSQDQGSQDNGGLITAGSTGVVGTGSLTWPVPCSHRVTSRFGLRIHPITGEERSHTGMDIDGYNNEGNVIVACDSGVVVKAAWYNGYGNCVIIDHGNGMQTLYGHMSGFAVSEGATVQKGQTIGYLGATGWATGTHCHLEVFVNGSRVDPEGYFSGMEFYNC